MISDLIFNPNLTAQELVLSLVFGLVVIFISLAVHEFAHAFVAYKMGDDTARLSGRLTLNPTKHIDGFGLFSFLLIGVGWAKPVPINPLKFKKYRTGIRLVSVAGIGANFILGLISAIIHAILLATVGITNEVVNYIYLLLQMFMMANSALILFNLLPIFPLDGYNFMVSFIKKENKFTKYMMRYGSLILIGILIFDSIIAMMFDFYLLDWFLSLINSHIYIPIVGLGVM